MTLRDWFAGQVLVGILGQRNPEPMNEPEDVVAQMAYVIADAMLKERYRES